MGSRRRGGGSGRPWATDGRGSAFGVARSGVHESERQGRNGSSKAGSGQACAMPHTAEDARRASRDGRAIPSLAGDRPRRGRESTVPVTVVPLVTETAPRKAARDTANLYRTGRAFAIRLVVECGPADRGFPPSASNPGRLGPQRNFSTHEVSEDRASIVARTSERWLGRRRVPVVGVTTALCCSLLMTSRKADSRPPGLRHRSSERFRTR